MIERLGIAIVLIVAGVVIYRGLQWRSLRRAAQKGQADPLLTNFVPGSPAIVYFTSVHCGACKFQQTPILTQLRENNTAAIQIIEIDADRQPEDAERWGVMSLPTTFVLDAKGKPRAVNYGVASAQKLRQQLGR